MIKYINSGENISAERKNLFHLKNISWNRFTAKHAFLGRELPKEHHLCTKVILLGYIGRSAFIEKIFRQINSLVKLLVSRNFCKKAWWWVKNSVIFHTFWQTFRESNVFTKQIDLTKNSHYHLHFVEKTTWYGWMHACKELKKSIWTRLLTNWFLEKMRQK